MRSSTLVGLALLLGALTAYLAAQWVGLGAQEQGRPHTKLVVAALPIEAGKAIADTQIKTIDWLSSEAPPQIIEDPHKVIGRVARFTLQPGEPVLESKLAPVDAKAGLSAIITEGKRAISVRVNEVIAVAGFTLPGNYVDVLVSGKDNDQLPFSRVVIARAKVLAIAQDTVADAAQPKVVNAVTLELTPQEAEVLDLARTVGTLSLVLRNESDQLPWQSTGTRMSDILGSPNGKSMAPVGAPLSASGTVSTETPSSGTRMAYGKTDRAAERNRSAVQEIRGTVLQEGNP
jgi:pilus assembly protein CpaB